MKRFKLQRDLHAELRGIVAEPTTIGHCGLPLLRRRDHFLAEEAKALRQRRESQPLQQLPDGGLRIAAKPVTPRWAMRSRTDGERSMVVVTFGESEDKPEVLALMAATFTGFPRPAQTT